MRTLLLIILLAIPALGSPDMSAEAVLAKHKEAIATLEDVKAQTALNLNLTLGILPYSEKLKGRYYFMQPNKHKLEFDDAPAYFDKAPDMFKWDLPSLEKYDVRAAAPMSNGGGRKFYDLYFKPKNPGSSTQSIRCRFEAENWRLVGQKTSYRDGGNVTLNFTYKSDTELPVLKQVKSSVSIPAYSLTGSATINFSDQKTNQGLDASIFEKSSK